MPKQVLPIHIFKAGRQITAAGEVIQFTEGDLAASAKAYDPKRHEAPFVIGHPKTDDPAKGWVHALSHTDRGLFALPDRIDPAFAEQVNRRDYGKVSAKFYRPDSPRNPVPGVWYLRHVGLLGAEPPAVKGLDDPAFSEVEDDCVLFTEGLDIPSDAMPAEVATADVVPADHSTPTDPAAVNPATPSPTQADPNPEETAVTPQEADRLKSENATLTQRLADMEAAQQKEAADRRHADNVAFAETLSQEGRIKADHVPLLAAVLDTVQAPDADGHSVAFGEGDDAQPMHKVLRGFLSALPTAVEFGEVATKDRAALDAEDDSVQYAEGTDPGRIEADKKIRAYMKTHNVDYRTAAQAVMK